MHIVNELVKALKDRGYTQDEIDNMSLDSFAYKGIEAVIRANKAEYMENYIS